jgi:hypothetical protein
MAHNEDNDPVDDDDQHVHPWQPNNPPQICLFYYGSTKLITSSPLSVWEMVSQRHQEVCQSFFYMKCCA